jgi:hypothetical protein
MDQFTIGPIVAEQDGERTKVSARISSPASITELWFRTTGISPWTGEDILIPASLFCAMQAGMPLHIRGTISAKQAGHLDSLQSIFNTWYPRCKKVPVSWDAMDDTPGKGNEGVGCFFSGGLDSFYTCLKHESEIDTLVLVHGFDIWLDDHELRRQVSSVLQDVADKLGKPLIEVETNLHEFTKRFIDWGLQGFGSGLASVAILLSSHLKKIYIPSSESYAHLEPCGSHPMLDPLWGTERLEIVHDGCEATRVEKAQRVAQSELALTHLRVCYQNLDEIRGQYGERPEKWNCGRCEKCVRTMINLHIADALELCPTFRNPLSYELVRQTDPKYDLAFFHMEENLRHLREKEGDTELTRALAECVENYRFRRLISSIEQQGEEGRASGWNPVSFQNRCMVPGLPESHSKWNTNVS